MQIPSRFTIAIHIIICVEMFKDEHKLTSDFIASSINVNPVIIRNILKQLKSANIVTVSRGNTGNIETVKSIKHITFFDIYKALDCVSEDKLFNIHKTSNKECPVGKNIYTVLDNKLSEIQNHMEYKMSQITIDDVFNEVSILIKNDCND